MAFCIAYLLWEDKDILHLTNNRKLIVEQFHK